MDSNGLPRTRGTDALPRAWECGLLQPLGKAVRRVLRKLKRELPRDPVLPLLGMCPREPMTGLVDIYTPCSQQHDSQQPRDRSSGVHRRLMHKRDVGAHQPGQQPRLQPGHLLLHKATVPATRTRRGSPTECEIKSKSLSSKPRLPGCVVPPPATTSTPRPGCVPREGTVPLPALLHALLPGTWPACRCPSASPHSSLPDRTGAHSMENSCPTRQ